MSYSNAVSTVNEICQLKKWTAIYTFIHESGPDHKPQFSAKLCVAGHVYSSLHAYPTHRAAKQDVASVFLDYFPTMHMNSDDDE